MINQIELAYISFATRMYVLKGSLANLSLVLNSLTIHQLKTFYIFAEVCTLNRIELNDLFREASCMYVFHRNKDYLIGQTQTIEKIMKSGYDFIYKKYEKQINQEQQLLGNMLYLITPLVMKYQ